VAESSQKGRWGNMLIAVPILSPHLVLLLGIIFAWCWLSVLVMKSLMARYSRIGCATLIVLAVVSVAKAQSPEDYIPVNAQILENVCNQSGQEMLCESYFRGVVDTYLAQYPSCKAGNFMSFISSVRDATLSTIRLLDPDMKSQTHASSIVAAVLVSTKICQPTATIEPQKKALPETCIKGLSFLSQKFADSYQKQAVLEILRNSGCLGN
jgi:hypothetical protein